MTRTFALARTSSLAALIAAAMTGVAWAQEAPPAATPAPAQAGPPQAGPPTDTDPRIIRRGRPGQIQVEGPGIAPPLANQGPRAPRAELQGGELPAAGEIVQAPEVEATGPAVPSTIAPLTRPGGPSLAEATPAVHARLAFMTERCRAVAGGQGDGARAVAGADLNGDGATDWLLEEGMFHCPGAPTLFRDARAGSTMSVFVGGAADPSRPSFSHGVYNAAMIEDQGVWTLWGVVGGPMCGQPVTPQTPLNEIRRCARPVGVATRASAADFAPLARAMSEPDWQRYVGSRLIGRWTQAQFPTCDTDAALRFNPDGTLAVGGSPGRWAIDNGYLAISIPTPGGVRRYSAKLARIGVATVDVQWNTQLDDGEPTELPASPLIRCPAPGAVPPPAPAAAPAPAEVAPEAVPAAPTAEAPSASNQPQAPDTTVPTPADDTAPVAADAAPPPDEPEPDAR